MKRQVLATVLLSIMASSAFALPAAEQAIPQVKADAVHFNQTLARSGSQEQENRDYAKGDVAENGSEQANKRAYTEGVAEGGADRLQHKGLAEGGAEHANERAYAEGVAEGGADRLQHQGLAEGGAEHANERAYAEGVAEGGADRLQELHEAQS